jgi:c(7)-type cytochrome triheme protein
MRRRIAFLMALLTGLALVNVAAQNTRPPAKLVFPSKPGNVTFDHAAHAKRAKNGCKTCHDKLWPRSAKVPLKSSDGCRTCHQAGGAAFEMKGNCAKCHAPEPAKT